jgi:iron complex transport system substrate-binding protein
MKKNIIIIFMLFSCCLSAFAAESTINPKRIISLSPSTTEILFALGLGDNVVGVTSYCDYPEEAKKKPKIGGMSNPSAEAVLSLRPDLVVMTTDGNPKEFEELLHSLHIKTYVFTARQLNELPQGIRELGLTLGKKDKADALARDIEAGIDKVKKSSLASHPSSVKKKILYIVWPEPLIVAGPGTIIDDAISLLGDVNIAQGAVAAYPKYSVEEVIRQAPDVILIGKGSGMDMVTVSRGLLKKMTSVPAVKTGVICYLGDGLYRLGPRVVSGIEELALCLKQK